jgi:hypothetical protein
MDSPAPQPSSTLYKINIAIFLPALALLVPAGIVCSIIPPMGLIPLGFSLINARIHLRQRDEPKSARRWAVHPFWDLAICLLDLGILLPLWIVDTTMRYWGRYASGGDILLEAYGSVFIIVNM